ncbi:MAG: GNAT family N-acetyltransferase [Methylococcaceae bacterium]|nr:GNAT family N-acetyltransferase [Methylococcaceae bacterium]
MMTTSSPNLDIYVANSFTEIEKYRLYWASLNKHPDADIDFFTYYVNNTPNVVEPYVLVASENQNTQAMIIGRLENALIPIKLGYFTIFRIKARQLVLLQDGYLGSFTREIERAMIRQILNSLQEGTADRAILCNLPVGSGLHQVAKIEPNRWCRDYANQTSERWKTQLPNSFDEFMSRRPKKHRYWLRRIARVFEEHAGTVEYKKYQKREDIDSFCRHAETIAKKTYQRGLGVGYIDNLDIRRRLELAADRGWLRAYILFANDEPVSFWCGRLYKDTMLLDWTGFIPSYRKYEIGTILFLKMVEDLCESGARAIDYGMGTSFYKERFGDLKCSEGSVLFYSLTTRGLFISAVTTLVVTVNSIAKVVASKLRILDWVKKYWRKQLASQIEIDATKPEK